MARRESPPRGGADASAERPPEPLERDPPVASDDRDGFVFVGPESAEPPAEDA